MYPYITFGDFKIPSYGLCMAIAIFVCAFLANIRARSRGISSEDMLIFSAVIVGAFSLGGGLLYIIVSYSLSEIYQYIINFDLAFLSKGGLVFFGGLIGGITGGLVCAKVLKLEIDMLEECVVPLIPLGHAVGRIGCLLAGCCRGIEYDGVFAVENKLFSATATYFPVQALEAVLNIGITVVLLLYIKKEHHKYDVLFAYLMIYAIVRFCLEFLRGDEIRGIFLGISTSQWVSLILFFACFVFKQFIYAREKASKKNF